MGIRQPRSHHRQRWKKDGGWGRHRSVGLKPKYDEKAPNEWCARMREDHSTQPRAEACARARAAGRRSRSPPSCSLHRGQSPQQRCWINVIKIASFLGGRWPSDDPDRRWTLVMETRANYLRERNGAERSRGPALRRSVAMLSAGRSTLTVNTFAKGAAVGAGAIYIVFRRYALPDPSKPSRGVDAASAMAVGGHHVRGRRRGGDPIPWPAHVRLLRRARPRGSPQFAYCMFITCRGVRGRR